MTKKYVKGTAEEEIVRRVSGVLPTFKDLFDEETFYIFAIILVIVAIIAAIIGSRFVKLKDADHRD